MTKKEGIEIKKDETKITKRAELENSISDLDKSLGNFLERSSLPIEGVIVDLNDRAPIFQNAETIIQNLPEEIRKDSFYLSKFFLSSAVGLFDASLNYLWDELINNLRKKVESFDIDYFYNVVVPPSRKKDFKDENDLIQLQDFELLEGCFKVGFIEEGVYKRLDFIRDIRNYSSAAHPSQDQIKSFELLSWLQIIIDDVLCAPDKPPVVKIKKLLKNIRESLIAEEEIDVIKETIRKMETEHAISLVKDLFGHYSDPRTSVVVKKNIKKIAKTAWNKCDEDTKYEFGIKSGQYAAVGDNDRAKLSREFLELVNGLSYLSEDQKNVLMRMILDDLQRVHKGNNNFYNEPYHAKQLIKYVSESGEIPDRMVKSYVEIIVECRIGNPWGVSWEALPYYDSMIQLFGEKEISGFLDFLISDSFFLNYGHSPKQLKNLKKIAKMLITDILNPIFKKALNSIITGKNLDDILSKLEKIWPPK